jgi:hypothetical protein
MSADSEPHIEIAFDCLPLRSVGRLDIPLDASEAFRRRAEKVKAALNDFGAERTYFLYNGHCVFRFANSDVEGACRHEFEGVVRTDLGDRLCQQVLVEVRLASETCGGIPGEVEAWLAERVRRAVGIEFDRFIAAGQLASDDCDTAGLGTVSGFKGIDV